ncbi:hypothetical protein Hdeb2414_s0077g00777381 [Helianthus debilis subsp. tardiflorus]
MCTFGIWKPRVPLPCILATCKTLKLHIYSLSLSQKTQVSNDQSISLSGNHLNPTTKSTIEQPIFSGFPAMATTQSQDCHTVLLLLRVVIL